MGGFFVVVLNHLTNIALGGWARRQEGRGRGGGFAQKNGASHGGGGAGFIKFIIIIKSNGINMAG